MMNRALPRDREQRTAEGNASSAGDAVLRRCEEKLEREKGTGMDKPEKKDARGKYFAIAIAVFALAIGIAYLTRLFLRGVVGMEAEEASLVTSMLEGIVASIAIAQVLQQLKRDESIEQEQTDIIEARFILEYNQAFIQDENMTQVEELLERQMEGATEKVIDSSHRQKCINYLVYLEGLAPLIMRDVLKLEHIDDLMAYRFFLAANSPAMQEDQLFQYPEYYLGCFRLYRRWKEYRLSEGKDILQGDTPLDRLYCRKARASDNKRKIAQLLFETDPYIFPAAFETKAIAADEFPFSGVFDLKNIFIAIWNGETVGAAVVCHGPNEKIDVRQAMRERSKLPKTFPAVCRDYFNQLGDYSEKSIYIACLSVDPDCRNQGVGGALLRYVFEQFPEAKVTLDVVEGNPAESLYVKLGFKAESEKEGYSLTKEKPKVKTMVREGDSGDDGGGSADLGLCDPKGIVFRSL